MAKRNKKGETDKAEDTVVAEVENTETEEEVTEETNEDGNEETTESTEAVVKRPEPPSKFNYNYFLKTKVNKKNHSEVCLASAAYVLLKDEDLLNKEHSEKAWREIIKRITGNRDLAMKRNAERKKKVAA